MNKNFTINLNRRSFPDAYVRKSTEEIVELCNPENNAKFQALSHKQQKQTKLDLIEDEDNNG